MCSLCFGYFRLIRSGQSFYFGIFVFSKYFIIKAGTKTAFCQAATSDVMSNAYLRKELMLKEK